MRNLTAIRDMRRLYDIRTVLSLSSNKKKIVCPLPQHVHHNRTPSFSIYVTPQGYQKFRCHGNCGLEGDVIDLIGYMRVVGYNPKNGDLVKQALSLLSSGTKIDPPEQKTTKAPALNNGLYKLYLPAKYEVVEYAASRGLRTETLMKFSVGQHRTSKFWMTMPVLHGSRLMSIKMRNLNSTDKKDRFMTAPGSVDGLFGYNFVDGTTKSVAIVKGEIPVMVMDQFGLLACAPTGGEGSYFGHEEHLRSLAFAKKRIVIGDTDRDPKVRGNMQAAAQRRAEIFRAELYFPPAPYTGIDDFVLAEPQVAIPLIKSWME